jgi:hypothetical protein
MNGLGADSGDGRMGLILYWGKTGGPRPKPRIIFPMRTGTLGGL